MIAVSTDALGWSFWTQLSNHANKIMSSFRENYNWTLSWVDSLANETGRLWNVKINTRFSSSVYENNLLNCKTQYQQPYICYTRRSINSNRILTIVDLYQLDTIARTCCCNNGMHAATSAFSVCDNEFMVTHVWQFACTLVFGMQGQRCMTGMMEDRQRRRDISTLELGQWPCALKSYVLILFNLAHMLYLLHIALIHLRRLLPAMLRQAFGIAR